MSRAVLQARIAEATHIADMLRGWNLDYGADLVALRRDSLRDAMAMFDDALQAEPLEPMTAAEITQLMAATTPEAEPSAPVAAPAAPPVPPAGEDEASAEPQPAPEVLAEVVLRRAPNRARPDLLTPERRALLAELWPDSSKDVPAIAAALTALPGPEIKAGSIYWLAQRCNLPTRRPNGRAKRQDARPAPEPAPPPSPEEREAQARRLMAEGHEPASIAQRAGLAPARVAELLAIAEAEARDLLRIGKLGTEDIVVRTSLPPGRIRELRRAIAEEDRAA